MRSVGVDGCSTNVYVGDVVQHMKSGELFIVTNAFASKVCLSVNDKVTIIHYSELRNYRLRACGTSEVLRQRMAEPCCIVDCSRQRPKG